MKQNSVSHHTANYASGSSFTLLLVRILTDLDFDGSNLYGPAWWRARKVRGQPNRKANCLRHVCNRLGWKFEMSTHVTGIELCPGPPMLD